MTFGAVLHATPQHLSTSTLYHLNSKVKNVILKPNSTIYITETNLRYETNLQFLIYFIFSQVNHFSSLNSHLCLIDDHRANSRKYLPENFFNIAKDILVIGFRFWPNGYSLVDRSVTRTFFSPNPTNHGSGKNTAMVKSTKSFLKSVFCDYEIWS